MMLMIMYGTNMTTLSTKMTVPMAEHSQRSRKKATWV